jgi:hypothetical protein
VLQIVVRPWLSPPVLGEGIHTTPSRNNQRVEELLAPSRPAQPVLSHQEKNGQADTVPDESRAHDEVRKTLTHVIGLAEAHHGNTTEEHLRPANNRHELSENTVRKHKDPPDTALAALLKMQLQVESQSNLRDKHEHQPVCEGVVDVRRELTTLVRVAEEIGNDGDNGSNYLDGNVPARTNDLFLFLD